MKISRLTSEISRGARKKHYPRQQTKKKKVMPSPLRIYKFDYLLKLKAVASNFKKYQAVAATGQLRRRRGHYYLLNLKKTTSRLRRNQVSLFKKKKFDGKFRSRVLNKMIGIFTKEGKRKKAAKHVYTAFLILSYLYNVSPLLVLEESVVKNLPIFLLKKYIVRRTQIKEYPVLAKKEKKIKTTIKWICSLVKKKAALDVKKDHFYLNIVSALDEIVYTGRGSELTSIFKNYTKSAVQNARNVRFNWRKLNKYRSRIRRKKKI